MKNLIIVIMLFCLSSLVQAREVLCFHTDKGTLYLFDDNSVLFLSDDMNTRLLGGWEQYGDTKIILIMSNGERKLLQFPFADLCTLPD